MTATLESFAAILKDQTSDLHTRAERHEIQRALVTGRIGRDGYRAYLGQMLHIHAALERALRAAAAAGGPLASLVRDYHFREEQIRADLAFLGEGEVEALPATAAFASWIGDKACPASLIGVLYVLEGSTNGGRYIARALRKSLALESGGTAFLDPHGEAQAERWTRFKTDLDSLGLSEQERAAALAAAQRTFEAIIAVNDDLGAAAPALAG
jgi:heme oxygenase